MIPFKARSRRRIDRTALLVWFVLGIIALSVVRLPSVARTQEGRVLLTARQMDGGGVQSRIVPMLNENRRLQKPPLAYWLADLSFNVLGSDAAGAGRTPFAIACWLTAGLNLLIGTRLFGPRAGSFAMAGTMGSVIAARYGLLAETDVLTMLGVTAAVYANWRGAEMAIQVRDRRDGTDASTEPPASTLATALWFHAGAIATGLTIIAKGPQGLFPALFLIGIACLRRRWVPLTAWLKSGAILSLLAIATPWFIYIFSTIGYAVIVKEIRVASLGGEHQGHFITYFGYLAADTLPFTGFLLAAIWFSARRLRRDQKLAGVVLWILVILVPLCCAGQKQRHYLMPLMPPLMMLASWYVDRATRVTPTRKHAAMIRGITVWTATAAVAAGFALPVSAWVLRHHIAPADIAAATLMVSGSLGTIVVLERFGIVRAIQSLSFTAAATVILLQNAWAPLVRPVSERSIALEVAQRYGGRPVHMLGQERLQLMFELRAKPGTLTTPEEVAAVLVKEPRTLFIERIEAGEKTNAPPFLTKVLSYNNEGEIDNVFEGQ